MRTQKVPIRILALNIKSIKEKDSKFVGSNPTIGLWGFIMSIFEDQDEKDEVYTTKDGYLVLRDSKGNCWILSPRDYIGAPPIETLHHLGSFKLCV